MTDEPFMQAVRDRDGEHPARVYPLANLPDEADFLLTRKLYAREQRIPLEHVMLVPGGPHQEHEREVHGQNRIGEAVGEDDALAEALDRLARRLLAELSRRPEPR